MAYGLVYQAEYHSPGGVSGDVYVYKKDYPGDPVITLYLKELQVDFDLSGWEDHVIGRSAILTFQNKSYSMSSALEKLMFAEEREYKVRITAVTDGPVQIVFEGFINCELTSQPYLGYGQLTLVASNYVSKLKYIYPESVNVLQNITFIDLIDDVLRLTGTEDNIMVNSSLEETSYPINSAGTQSMLNLYGVYTEMFWENNVDRKNGIDILEIVLTVFGCYLYWHDGYWYIERYDDLWSTDKSYVEYTTGNSYSPDSTATLNVESWAIGEIHDFVFTGMSQKLGGMPGKRQINIALDENKYFNLTTGDLFNSTEIHEVWLDTSPDWREWYLIVIDDPIEASFSDLGEPYKNISNGVVRAGEILGSYLDGGLMTMFKVKVQDNTALNIEWKFATSRHAIPGNMAVPEETDVSFRWYLKMNEEFIIQLDDSDIEWKVTNGATTYSGKENEINITGDQFDQELWAFKCNVTIPLGEVDGLANGTYDMQFIIGCETFEWEEYGPGNADIAAIGDVLITITEDLPDNYLEGEVDNDYLEELNIDMKLFDVDNVNYKNNILCDSDLDVLSSEWTDGDNTNTLARLLLISKWKRYHSTKRIIQGDAHDTELYHPLQMFTDEKDGDRKFVLTRCSMILDKDIKQGLKLMEYDDESITLI